MNNTEQSNVLATQHGGSSRRRRPLVLGAVLVAGLALGAGGFAIAATVHGQFDVRQGMRLAFIQHMALHALDAVGATSAQETKVHDIIAQAFADIAPSREEHEALRQHVLDLLQAPTIDRAAIEKMRADRVAAFDAKSKKLVAAVLDIADQLTPDQRTALVAHLESMHDRFGPMSGHWPGMPGRGDGPGFEHGTDGSDKN